MEIFVRHILKRYFASLAKYVELPELMKMRLLIQARDFHLSQ